MRRIALLLLALGCARDAGVRALVVHTSADGRLRLAHDTVVLASSADPTLPTIHIDTTPLLQPVEGFGYTLTGGSAQLLHHMSPGARATLLQELFGVRDRDLGVSYLRLSIGASDLDSAVFSYDDLPGGQRDPQLTRFSIARDEAHLVPVLKEILAINPAVRLMATPWSPPAWMKTNGRSVGGRLRHEDQGVYAQYLVRYLQAYAAHGITIDAITPQNEPHHGGNNPSMEMSAAEQAEFVGRYLGPALQAAGQATKIVVWDHNADTPEYPIHVLNDSVARPFVHGSAFHLYAGTPEALGRVHDAHPDKALYFTEQWTGARGTFGDDLLWHLRHVVIGTMRQWSRTALEWNLANDPQLGPHTPGGCNECLGALTIDGDSVVRNVSYHIIGQVARHVPPGSRRLDSTVPPSLPNVAFRRPDGRLALVVVNDQVNDQAVRVAGSRMPIAVTIRGRSVATIVWPWQDDT